MDEVVSGISQVRLWSRAIFTGVSTWPGKPSTDGQVSPALQWQFLMCHESRRGYKENPVQNSEEGTMDQKVYGPEGFHEGL